jgi:hypothetical protein
MDVGGGLLVPPAHFDGQRLHHRHGERHAAPRDGHQRRRIVERRIAGGGDGRGVLLRDQAGGRDGMRQFRLEAQPVAERRFVGKGLGDFHRGVKGIHQTAGHLRSHFPLLRDENVRTAVRLR